jgi:hypothetical protein
MYSGSSLKLWDREKLIKITKKIIKRKNELGGTLGLRE